jgi:hypothetical protein
VSRRVEQAIISPICTKTFEKILEKKEIFEFLAIFSIFEAEARLGALKTLKIHRTKVVLNKYLHILRL